MEQLVIYKLGETHLQTTITNGYADYTNSKRPETYLDELGPGYACLPYDQALELIGQAERKKYLDAPWEEITEEAWFEWLEVLPPEAWQNNDGVDIFRLCEYQTSNITRHCARYAGRFFTSFRRTSEPRNFMATQIKINCQKADLT
jgi:hypothetical protein